MKLLAFAALSLGACASQAPERSSELFDELASLNQVTTLQLECIGQCRLIDVEASERHEEAFFTTVSTDCGTDGLRDCIEGEGFIQYYDPRSANREWVHHNARYELREDHISSDGTRFRHVDQYEGAQITRSYFVENGRLFMLVHQPRVCSGEHGICYRRSHFDQLLFKILR